MLQKKRELLSENIEGKRTRILYMGPKDLSPLGALRNYQKAFADLGEVEEVYTCKDPDCFSNLGGVFIWRKSNQIANDLDPSSYLYGQPYYYKDQLYWYGKVMTPKSRYHVSVYAAVMTERAQVEETRHHPLIIFEMIEVTDFKPTLGASSKKPANLLSKTKPSSGDCQKVNGEIVCSGRSL